MNPSDTSGSHSPEYQSQSAFDSTNLVVGDSSSPISDSARPQRPLQPMISPSQSIESSGNSRGDGAPTRKDLVPAVAGENPLESHPRSSQAPAAPLYASIDCLGEAWYKEARRRLIAKPGGQEAFMACRDEAERSFVLKVCNLKGREQSEASFTSDDWEVKSICDSRRKILRDYLDKSAKSEGPQHEYLRNLEGDDFPFHAPLKVQGKRPGPPVAPLESKKIKGSQAKVWTDDVVAHLFDAMVRTGETLESQGKKRSKEDFWIPVFQDLREAYPKLTLLDHSIENQWQALKKRPYKSEKILRLQAKLKSLGLWKESKPGNLDGKNLDDSTSFAGDDTGAEDEKVEAPMGADELEKSGETAKKTEKPRISKNVPHQQVTELTDEAFTENEGAKKADEAPKVTGSSSSIRQV